MTKEMCVEKSVQMFVKLKREHPHLIGLKRSDAIFYLKKETHHWIKNNQIM